MKEASRLGVGTTKKQATALSLAQEINCWTHSSKAFDEEHPRSLNLKNYYNLGKLYQFRVEVCGTIHIMLAMLI